MIFGVDPTWVGWIFIIDMMLSVPLHLFRATQVKDYRRSPGESAIMAVGMVLYLVGFFTVGFVEPASF